MKARIFSAIVLVALVLSVLVFAPAWASLAAIVVAITLCAWEWSVFLRPRGIGERLAFLALVVVLLGLSWRLTTDVRALRALLWVASAWWLAAFVLVLRGPGVASRSLAWIAGLFVLVPAGIALMRLRLEPQHGAGWTLFVLVLVWAADTGAFFAGKAFGRHRLAPDVSPGKTWEGVAGGLLLAGVTAAVASRGLEQPLVPLVLIGLVVAAFSVVGDLTESLFKRFAGVKDSGHLIPGHGGLMDRLDSVTAAAPLLLLGLTEILATPS
jgi:phosphatidate cytidylyltransferase